MTVTLREMDESGLAAFIAASNAAYRQERIDSGDSEEYADERVAQSNAEYFPAGRPADGQYVFDVVESAGEGDSSGDGGGTVVGTLWIGVITPARPDEWWVFDVEIAPEHRRRGHGREAMRLAEEEARARGAVKLGLNVFGHNVVAQNLYRSLGYAPTAINMSKPL